MTYLQLNKVSKRYGRDSRARLVLEAIDLNVVKGEFVSSLGPSGCGKSTLLKCCAGLEIVTSGQVFVNGKVITEPPAGLAMVFQRDILLDWRTILDNVLINAEFNGRVTADIRARAIAQLERFGLSGLEKAWPWQLSGGMRQRVSICRALLMDPDFLLMDEPFGALDAMTRDDLNVEVARIWQETRKTIVFITHSITEAIFLSDRVIMMDRNPGRIVEDLRIELPRPRRLAIRETREFSAYSAHIRQIFTGLGIVKDA